MRSILIFLFFTISLSQGGSASGLVEAHKDYLFGNYQGAIAKATALRASSEQHYFLGLAHMKIGEYERARLFLERLRKNFPHSSQSLPALVKIADSYFLEGEYKQAAAIYKKIKNRSSSFDFIPHVNLRLIQIAAKEGDWPAKNKYIKEFRQKYPQSAERSFVDIIESYGDFFTIQVGAFSEKKNALVLKVLLSKVYKSYIVEDRSFSPSLYKVRVGRYRRRYEAEKVYSALRAEGYPARIYP
jgi:tetratricopeptide (TPR) repeat protein